MKVHRGCCACASHSEHFSASRREGEKRKKAPANGRRYSKIWKRYTIARCRNWKVERVDCITALTGGVTLSKGTECDVTGTKVHRLRRGRRSTCAAPLRFLHRRTFYWETVKHSLACSPPLGVGKFDSHATQHETRCIWLSNDAVNITVGTKRLRNRALSTRQLTLLHPMFLCSTCVQVKSNHRLFKVNDTYTTVAVIFPRVSQLSVTSII